KLRNRGVILEMNLEEAAEWLRGAPVQFSFTQHFGDAVSVKDRVFPVLVEFVPVTFQPEALGESKRVEKVNGMARGSIGAMSWVKPIYRWSAGQRTAHAVIRARSAMAANAIIRD
ncbi:hypothetical protein JAAARDRAFT_108568, partial [Jaapia argillacea MUCL 33604]